MRCIRRFASASLTSLTKYRRTTRANESEMVLPDHVDPSRTNRPLDEPHTTSPITVSVTYPDLGKIFCSHPGLHCLSVRRSEHCSANLDLGLLLACQQQMTERMTQTTGGGNGEITVCAEYKPLWTPFLGLSPHFSATMHPVGRSSQCETEVVRCDIGTKHSPSKLEFERNYHLLLSAVLSVPAFYPSRLAPRTRYNSSSRICTNFCSRALLHCTIPLRLLLKLLNSHPCRLLLEQFNDGTA